jgi:hypothetical protein
MYFTAYHDVLCGWCEQVEQSKHDARLEDRAEWTSKDKTTLENQLANCLQENESLRQYMQKEEAVHQVS